MPAMTVEDYPHSGFRRFNTARHQDGAGREVERARSALAKLDAAPPDPDMWRTSDVLDRYVDAVQLRVDYPRDTVAELAARAGMSKGRYWSIFRRALLFAETLPENPDMEWALFR